MTSDLKSDLKLNSEEKDRLKGLLYFRSTRYEKLSKLLDLVKDFIIAKNRILVGGMSIDLALKMKGSQLYSDTEMPDYDIRTPEHHEDAVEFGRLLCNSGYNNVQIINAIHVTSMRVGVDFDYVFDITYSPIDVYRTIPTIIFKGTGANAKFNGLRLRHPHHQYIDQHISLSFPLRGMGNQFNVSHRWDKDIERHLLLKTYYPVSLPVVKDKPKDTFAKVYQTETKLNYALCGVSAYNAIVDLYHEFCTKTSTEPIKVTKLPIQKHEIMINVTNDVVGGKKSAVSLQDDADIDAVKEVSVESKDVQLDHPDFGAVLKRHPRIPEIIFPSTEYKDVIVYHLDDRVNVIKSSPLICSVQYIMLTSLYNHFHSSSTSTLASPELNLLIYKNLEMMVTSYDEYRLKNKDDPSKIDDPYDHVFYPSMEIFGSSTHSERDDISKESLIAQYKNDQRTLETIRNKLPAKLYISPGSCDKPVKSFDYTSSPYF